MKIRVWTDGSGTTGGPAGIAFVAVAEEDGFPGQLQVAMPLRNATNQQAELLAAALALDAMPDGSEVTVVSDSEYVVLGVNEQRKRKANQDHWARLDAAIALHESVTFEWCRGHDGVPENELADRLAGEARERAKERADGNVNLPRL